MVIYKDKIDHYKVKLMNFVYKLIQEFHKFKH